MRDGRRGPQLFGAGALPLPTPAPPCLSERYRANAAIARRPTRRRGCGATPRSEPPAVDPEVDPDDGFQGSEPQTLVPVLGRGIGERTPSARNVSGLPEAPLGAYPEPPPCTMHFPPKPSPAEGRERSERAARLLLADSAPLLSPYPLLNLTSEGHQYPLTKQSAMSPNSRGHLCFQTDHRRC